MTIDPLAYLLVTPVKNEEDSLPALIQSVVDQSLRPLAWFIVDDASEDASSQIIREGSLRHSWIHPVRLDTQHEYDIGEHYASVCAKGFDCALDYCNRHGLDFGYIALSDADMVYPTDYFKRCAEFLHVNRQFGIVSGAIWIRDDRGNGCEEGAGMKLGNGHPRGSGRVWRREAFEETGGYVVGKAPDTISNIKALSKGWKIRQLANVRCYQTRATLGKTGLRRGYFLKGEAHYYLHGTILGLFNSFVQVTFISRRNRSVMLGLMLLAGYLKSFLAREQKLDDTDVKRFMGSYKRIFANYWLFIKALWRRGEAD